MGVKGMLRVPAPLISITNYHRLGKLIESCEKVVPIAQLAADHFREHGRPLKIGVDELYWLYHTVTTEKEKEIKKCIFFASKTENRILICHLDDPRSSPVEKAIFQRICGYLRLNIDLVFVFDSLKRPAKINRLPLGNRYEEGRKLLKGILEGFDIPYIDAPGEAEAECCNLQNLGIVDAVWSNDLDCFMFGCSLRIRDHRVPIHPNGKNGSKGQTTKDKVNVLVAHADVLQSKWRLNREGCVLFAILAGADYSRGLGGCGAKIVRMAAQASLGMSLCEAESQADCDRWRTRVLEPFFKLKKISLRVPSDFPSFTMLQYYNHPRTHSQANHRKNPQFAYGFRRSFNERSLLDMTSKRFNIWGKEYMDRIVPTMLTSMLADRNIALPIEVLRGIEMVATKWKKDQPSTEAVRKIIFCPFSVTRLDQALFLHDEEVR